MSLKQALWLSLACLATVFIARRTFASDPSRGALWRVVETCVAAKRALNVSLPCVQVNLGQHGSPGTVVLRPPWKETHTLVVPTTRLVGIEAPALQQPEAAAYWQAALAARRFVVEAAKGRVHVEDVALAVNSRGSRTQDQLHIHADCARPEVLAALRLHDAELGSAWKPLEFLESLGFPHDNQRFFGIKIAADEIGTSNIFERLTDLPGSRRDLSRVGVAVFSAPPNGSRQDFYVVAAPGRDSQAEDLLDHSCVLARGVAADDSPANVQR
ncbi:CDP-diacylglycerol diphosphatase [Microvirga terrae]|uniref:CDP-diacylglycerol pyrophosphatase n=1 Tax=Microvirga terrae TaxID=2740529 RepID=A0ABY5RUX2_9HYPH|nr:CDP-diacylglycerol diphosphatase [Microvirga terrae]UVF19977.1 CDP-diacylglycerol diphosphatase [Microvirga terrae]